MRTKALLLLILAAACAPSATSDPSEGIDRVSPVRRIQMATRVYRKLVGRDPTPAAIDGLKDKDLPGMVESVLSSPEYTRDGFFHFERDRLLLHVEPDEAWQRDARVDHCALKMELEDVAREDRSGAGFFSVLKYRQRWVPVEGQCLEASVTGETAPQQCALSPDIQSALAALEPAERARPFLLTAPGRTYAEQLLAGKFRKGQGPVSFRVLEGVRALPQGVVASECTTADYATAPPGSTIFVKVEVPEELGGVHASPYWLSRHPTTEKNQSLHRARLVYFSYFCTEVNPDQAATTGGQPVIVPELVPYFSPTDDHAKSAAACYNCHTTVQPLANYFGELARGRRYGNDFGAPQGFFADGGGFRRPGGLWLGSSFFNHGAGEHGMAGLANLLSNSASANDCIVRSTWASLVGPRYPLTDYEREQASRAFAKDGTPRLSSLLTHLMSSNKRGKAFFEGGEAQLETTPPEQPEIDCNSDPAPRPELGNVVGDNLPANCSGCHRAGSVLLFDAQKNWKPERAVPGKYPNLAAAHHAAYCQVKTDKMPKNGWNPNIQPEAAKRKHLIGCWLAGKRNEIARASSDPAEQAFDGKSCDTTPTPSPGPNPHPLPQ
jgi:hypothetical protein